MEMKVIIIQMIFFSFGLFRIRQYETCDINVTDNTKENSLLYNLNSIDQSTQTDINKKFNLLLNSKVNNLFNLHHNGKLHSATTIDREALCSTVEVCCNNKDPCKIILSIAVRSDKKEEPKTFDCHVNIVDINDNPPQFPQDKITIGIKESDQSGSLFSLPVASDKDSEQFSIRDYKIEEKSTFPPVFSLEQNSFTGSLQLKLIQPLDREKRANYEFNLLAIDRGDPPKTGKLIININVIDVNDNPPQLMRSNYVINYDEGKFSAQPLVTIEAKDDDENENAKLHFKIINEQPMIADATKYFRIEENNGNIYLKEKLDYEKCEKHKFFVKVSNNVDHSDTVTATVTATVTIQVNNLNDERPEITINYLNDNNKNALIKENEETKRKFVAIATVNDKDKGTEGQVFCKLVNFENEFELSNPEQSTPQIQYYIYTRITLDRELIAYYELKMECEDKGNPSLKTNAHIKVLVKDENDNSPIIKIDNNISVYENKQIGTLVTQITATDSDEGKNSELIYSINESLDSTKKYLDINPNTGELKTKMEIDREYDSEPLQSLPVILIVSDNGTPKLSTRKMFDVTIKDENDNPPEFAEQFYQFRVTENQLARFTLGEIEVKDKDDTSHLRVSLAYSSNDLSSPFTIFVKDNKYYLNTTRSLDWEKEKNYSLKIIASDGEGFKSHTVTTTISVLIDDENDHAPIFIFPNFKNFSKTVSFQELVETVIATVSARDNDSKDSINGKFSFLLTNDNKGLFKIDSATGKITTSRTMTRQDIGKYSINIIVQDQGTPQKQSETQMTIEIDDSKPLSKGPFYDDIRDMNDEGKKLSGNFIMTKESFLITSLIILLLFLLLCIFIVLYMRHIRGLFPMLPDIFDGCSCINDKRSSQKKNLTYNKSMCDIPINDSKHFSSANSPLDFQQQVRNNENSIMPFYFNQYDSSINTTVHPIDQKLPVNQYRQYETMKYQPYSPPIISTKSIQNYNYDQLLYHHPCSSPCEETFTIQTGNTNNIYDSRIKTIPSNLQRDLVTCNRIVNNIDSSPLVSKEQIFEQKKERFASNICLKTDLIENMTTETSLTKTPDIKRHNKNKADKIDTYAVTYPKEQSTFV